MSLNLLTRYGMMRAPSGAGGAEESGIESLGSVGDDTTTDTRERGWEFEVGGSELTLTGLRFYSVPSGGDVNRAVSVWRESDGELMASGTVVGVADAWAEVSVTNVALAANTKYVVSFTAVSGVRMYAKNHTDSVAVTFNSAITFVKSRVADAGDTAVMPANAATNTERLWGYCDVLFTA